jgi:hypothetical protein
VSLTEEKLEDIIANFLYALRAPETKRQYPRRFKVFLDFLQLGGTFEEQTREFMIRARQNGKWVQDNFMRFIQFQKERAKREEISESTISNYYKATKLFCEMNDLAVGWKKIARGLPVGRRAANDRAPTLEEIQKLVEYPDRRLKPIIYTMVSSGIRIGAWDYLLWKHVTPIHNEQGEVIAAKLLIYPGDQEEYYTFITPEAYTALKDWMDFRASYGEKITGESWLMRDLWQTSNMKYGAKFGLATSPKRLKSSAIKRLIERALWEQGLRHILSPGRNRHEWKAAHGYRKYYKSHAEQAMRPINVETTMGHDIGVSKSYWRPTEQEVLQDYLKTIDPLTINGDKRHFQSQIVELKEKSKDSEYIIQTKLQEKDKDIAELKAAVKFLMNKANAAAIADPSSEMISNEKGFPKKIKVSAMTNSATCEIAK